MGWGPSAVYVVDHLNGWKVEDLRISSIAFDRASKGNLHHQTKICLQIRHRIEKDYGGDPGFIYYDELTFTKVRDIPSSAKRPPKMKADKFQLKRSHADTLSPRR